MVGVGLSADTAVWVWTVGGGRGVMELTIQLFELKFVGPERPLVPEDERI